MSNLATTVKFDVLRGWPNGGAVEEPYHVSPLISTPEGVLVVLDTGNAGAVVLPTAVANNGAATGPTKFRMVIQGNDQFDGSFTQKCVTLRGNFTVQTEKFVAAAGIVVGARLTVHVAVDANQGWLQVPAANEQIVGEVESVSSDGSSIVVSMHI